MCKTLGRPKDGLATEQPKASEAATQKGEESMGSLGLSPKVWAALVAAIITYVLTQFAVDIGRQEANLINAAAPVIVGYLWDDAWDWKPKRKIIGAFLAALVAFLVFKLGLDWSKELEGLVNALLPVLVALVVRNGSEGEEPE